MDLVDIEIAGYFSSCLGILSVVIVDCGIAVLVLQLLAFYSNTANLV